MAESFGARLRQQRERQQISIASIAEQTKINVALLEALERDDVSHWPSGIFRRAFIRAYARAFCGEPDAIVREFLERYPDPADIVPAEPLAAPGAARPNPNEGPPIRLRYLVGSAAGSLSRLWMGAAGTRPAVAESAVAATPHSEPRDFHSADLSTVVFESVDPLVVERDVAGSESAPVDVSAATALPLHEPDLLAAAHLCTELGRIYEPREAEPLLQRAASILDAVGVIVWAWDAQNAELRPALAHGYSDSVLAQLPRVRREADNATAAAFRSTQTCIVNGSEMGSGAVAVPLMTASGCVGVFAAELRHGGEQKEPLRAIATIFAAQLASLIGTARLPQAVNA
jgi:transcriptional regulator with XRE-family HTH domain